MQMVQDFKRKCNGRTIRIAVGLVAFLAVFLGLWLPRGEELKEIWWLPTALAVMGVLLLVKLTFLASKQVKDFEAFIGTLSDAARERLNIEYQTGERLGSATLTSDYLILCSLTYLKAIAYADIQNTYPQKTIHRINFIPFYSSYDFHIELWNKTSFVFRLKKFDFVHKAKPFVAELAERIPDEKTSGQPAVQSR